MSQEEFVPFPSIEYIGKLFMTITQKLHGTNAQVYIYKDDVGEMQLKCGNRTRWLGMGTDDNFGFNAFVQAHRDEFIEKLGPGRHYGEWVGPGINSGEGLKEKQLALFNVDKFERKAKNDLLPTETTVVPVLYRGKLDLAQIDSVMKALKEGGSLLAPGFMRVEGIVVRIGGTSYKKVFAREETRWRHGEDRPPRPPQSSDAYAHLMQPIRLEKLLSRDEGFLREYPHSLSTICKLYIEDLIKEEQITGNEDEIDAIKKAASKHIFGFIRTVIPSLNTGAL